MNSTIKHAVKICDTHPELIEVYAGGHWPHLTLTTAQALNLWTQLGEVLAQRLTVSVADLEALVARWSNADEHFGDDHGKAMAECAGELRALIDRAGGGA